MYRAIPGDLRRWFAEQYLEDYQDFYAWSDNPGFQPAHNFQRLYRWSRDGHLDLLKLVARYYCIDSSNYRAINVQIQRYAIDVISSTALKYHQDHIVQWLKSNGFQIPLRVLAGRIDLLQTIAESDWN